MKSSDWRIKRITDQVKKYDRTLFAVRTNTGMVQIWRKAEKWSAVDLIGDDVEISSPTQFIVALTDNWTLRGTPCEWGLLPIYFKLVEMDAWNGQPIVDELRKQREQAQENKNKAMKNDIRARAYDMRKEFAKATNDINTASL